MYFRLIGQCSQIFGQAGSSERKARQKVSGGDIKLFILAEDVHDSVCVDRKSLAKIADLVREADLERMPAIVDILDHLRGLQIGSDQRRIEFSV